MEQTKQLDIYDILQETDNTNSDSNEENEGGDE